MQWTDGPNAGFTNGPSTWLPLGKNYTSLNVKVIENVEDRQIQIEIQTNTDRDKYIHKRDLNQIEAYVVTVTLVNM